MKTLLCVLAMLVCFCGHAAADDEEAIKAGVAAYYAAYSIDDPDGSTDGYGGIQPINLVSIIPISLNGRVYIEGGWVDFEVDASSTNIANTVSGYRLASGWQWRIRASRHWHFWVGGGLAYSQLDFKSRYTVLNSGYLQTRYPDRSKSAIGGFVNLSKEWEISERFDFGLNVSYQYPFGGESVSGLNAGAAVYYKFGVK